MILQLIINGLLLGGVYAIMGVGMTMIFGIVKLTNLAHGEFIIIGAYASTLLATKLGVDPILTLIITIPLMFLIGMGLQSGLINRVMLKGSEPALLVTFGLSIILQDAMLLLFTADARHTGGPYSSKTFHIGSISIALLDVILLIISLITILVLAWFLKSTYLGRSIRAISDDTQAASLMGVNVKRTYGVAMGIAMATAAVAGLCVALKWTFYPSSGGSYLLTSFGVGVIGGMGSIPGALAAGFIFGIATVCGGANYGTLVGYLILIAMLAIRPQGLFSK